MPRMDQTTVEAFHGPIAQKAIKSELGTIPVFVLAAIENIGYVANYRITKQSGLKTAIEVHTRTRWVVLKTTCNSPDYGN